MKILLVLPLPDKHLSPNSRGGTRWKCHYVRRAVDEAIKTVQIAVKEQALDCSQLPLPFAVSSECYYWPTRAHRDLRNAESSMKAYYDGFVRGGLLEDDSIEHLLHLPSTFALDRVDPRVEVTIIGRGGPDHALHILRGLYHEIHRRLGADEGAAADQGLALL